MLLFCCITPTLLRVNLARLQLSMACLPAVSKGALTAIAGALAKPMYMSHDLAAALQDHG